IPGTGPADSDIPSHRRRGATPATGVLNSFPAPWRTAAAGAFMIHGRVASPEGPAQAISWPAADSSVGSPVGRYETPQLIGGLRDRVVPAAAMDACRRQQGAQHLRVMAGVVDHVIALAASTQSCGALRVPDLPSQQQFAGDRVYVGIGYLGQQHHGDARAGDESGDAVPE